MSHQLGAIEMLEDVIQFPVLHAPIHLRVVQVVQVINQVQVP